MLRAIPVSVMGTRAPINVRARTFIAGGVRKEEAVMRQSIGLGVVAVVVTLLGCNSGGKSPGASSSNHGSSEGGEQGVPNAAVHKTGSGSVSALLGPPGGSLELSSGAKVEVPAGALDGAQDFVLKEAPMTTAFFNEEHERPVGPTFIFSPGVNAPEGGAIKVSIPLASYPQGWGDVALGYEYPVGEVVGAEDSEHTRWQYEDAKLTGGRAVAELPGVNGYRLQFVLSNLEAK